MNTLKPANPVLNVGDTIVLKEAQADGWWKVEINGETSRVLIGRTKAIRRTKSSEEKEKVMTRSSSKKDASINGSGVALPPDSIAHPKNHQSFTTSSIPSSSYSSIATQTSPRTHTDLRSTGLSPRPLEGEHDENALSDGEAAPHSSGSSKDTLTSSKKRARREKSSTARGLARSPSVRGSPAQVKADLLDIALDIEASHTDLSLIMRALETEAGVKMPESTASEEALILEKLSKEQRFLDKMLDGSYTPLFNADAKLKPGIALAPLRLLSMSELLIPPVNLGVLPVEEKLALQHLEFNVFPYKDANNEHHVRLLLMAMFYDFDLPRIFQIPDVTLYRFFTVVSRKYRHVPFHNFYHAFNVTQTMYFFLRTGLASHLLGPLEIMACLIAAVCHDLDHPGLNNDFQRKAQTRVYHMHKKSILENHHYLQCMAALANTESNILANLSQEDEDQIYIYLRDLILATDLAVHGIILKSLTERKKFLAKYSRADSPAGMNEEDRKLIMVSLMKCADLSNEVRENSISKSWAKLVMEEFFAQSSLERQLKLPVTPFMDKEKIIITKEQINFIEKLCLPLYTQLAGVFPEIERCCLNLEQNRATWQDRLRLFFSSPEELKKLSNKSIWEREQVKTKTSNQSVSATLTMLASNSQLPTGSRRASRAPAPIGFINSGARDSPAAPSGSTPATAALPPPLPSNTASSSGSVGAAVSSAVPAPPILPSVSSPDVSSKKDKEKDKEKDKKDEKDKANRTKETHRAVSAGVPAKTPKK